MKETFKANIELWEIVSICGMEQRYDLKQYDPKWIEMFGCHPKKNINSSRPLVGHEWNNSASKSYAKQIWPVLAQAWYRSLLPWAVQPLKRFSGILLGHMDCWMFVWMSHPTPLHSIPKTHEMDGRKNAWDGYLQMIEIWSKCNNRQLFYCIFKEAEKPQWCCCLNEVFDLPGYWSFCTLGQLFIGFFWCSFCDELKLYFIPSGACSPQAFRPLKFADPDHLSRYLLKLAVNFIAPLLRPKGFCHVYAFAFYFV